MGSRKTAGPRNLHVKALQTLAIMIFFPPDGFAANGEIGAAISNFFPGFGGYLC